MWWLIARDGSLEPLTVTVSPEDQVLPIFSFREEAEMFHFFAGLSGCWRVRPSRHDELASLRYGAAARVTRVALDPLAEMLVDGTVGLVSLEWDLFVDYLAGRSPR